MFSNNDKISLRQLKILFILDLFSTTSLILPRVAAETAGKDGWVAIILGTLLALVYLIVITYLIRKFKNETFIEFGNRIIGRALTSIIGVVFGIKLLITVSFTARLFAELIKEILLPKTPIQIIIISMLLLVSYVARKGYECRARVAEIVIWIVLIPIVLVMIYSIKEVKFTELMPIFTTDYKDILMGAFSISLTYSAIELLLIVAPHTEKPNNIKRPMVMSLLIVGCFNLILFIITLGIFGEVGVRRQIYPVMTLMQVIKIPGSIIERQDALMVSFWIISIFAVVNSYVFFISVIIQKIFRFTEQRFLVLPIVPFVFIGALIPNNIIQAYEYVFKTMTYIGLLFLLFIPALLIIISKIKKVGEPIESD